jgi:hypothetical protein
MDVTTSETVRGPHSDVLENVKEEYDYGEGTACSGCDQKRIRKRKLVDVVFSTLYPPPSEGGAAHSSAKGFFPRTSKKLKFYKPQNASPMLHQAVLRNDPGEIRRIITRNAESVNIQDKTADNQTALALAVSKGDIPLSTLLLDLKADPNIPSKEGIVPLHEALGREIQLSRLLLENGADPNCRDPGVANNTPLQVCVRLQKLDFCEMFIEFGADPDLHTPPPEILWMNEQETPLSSTNY